MTPKTKDGLSTITFFEHEYEMWKQRRSYKRTLLAAAAVIIAQFIIRKR